MKMNAASVMVVFAIALFSATNAMAVITSKPIAGDHRLHVINYSPTEMIKYTGYYGYQASIVFEDDEEFKTISMGVSNLWMMNPVGHRLFLKPLEADATTNMMIITNKRVYHFLLYGAEAEDINDPNLVFETRFVYNDAQGGGYAGIVTGGKQRLDSVPYPDLAENPGKYNFNYTISGPEVIAPLRIFDDGEFTYFEFKDKNADVPSIFMVDVDGSESLINFRTRGDYIVVERVSSAYTLRLGKHVLCVFNEARPMGGVKAGQYSQ